MVIMTLAHACPREHSLLLACHQEGVEGSREQAAGSARTDATAALKPFLHEHAAHFWHELRCGPDHVHAYHNSAMLHNDGCLDLQRFLKHCELQNLAADDRGSRRISAEPSLQVLRCRLCIHADVRQAGHVQPQAVC